MVCFSTVIFLQKTVFQVQLCLSVFPLCFSVTCTGERAAILQLHFHEFDEKELLRSRTRRAGRAPSCDVPEHFYSVLVSLSC